jgi:hypothetical protein
VGGDAGDPGEVVLSRHGAAQGYRKLIEEGGEALEIVAAASAMIVVEIRDQRRKGDRRPVLWRPIFW